MISKRSPIWGNCLKARCCDPPPWVSGDASSNIRSVRNRKDAQETKQRALHSVVYSFATFWRTVLLFSPALSLTPRKGMVAPHYSIPPASFLPRCSVPSLSQAVLRFSRPHEKFQFVAIEVDWSTVNATIARVPLETKFEYSDTQKAPATRQSVSTTYCRVHEGLTSARRIRKNNEAPSNKSTYKTISSVSRSRASQCRFKSTNHVLPR